MDLAELKFVVNTDDLDSAAIKIKTLSAAAAGLNAPLKAIAQASDKASTATKAVGDAAVVTTDSTKKQVTILERQQKVLEYMTQGFSKGQSSVLAYGDAAGLTTKSLDELGKVLQTQRTLMGTDPFDKSLGALQSLKNEYTVLKEVQRLYNAELGLSRSQMEDLAREKLRLIEKLKLEGKSLTDVKSGIMELNAAYLSNAAAETTLSNNMKAREKATKDAAASSTFLEKEMRRVDAALSEVNSNLLISNSNRLLKFQDELRKSGVTGAAAATQLETYCKKLIQIQDNSAFRKQSEDADAYKKKVDYITRAVGPQLTDIFSGLATGQQSLYTILVQQGGQLADQFSLAGIEANKMGAILQSALPKMITNFTDIGKAIGVMFIGGLKQAGSAVTNFATSITGTKKVLAEMQIALEISAAAGSTWSKGLLAVAGTVSIAIGAALVAVVASFVALGVAYAQVIKEESKLSKALAISGGSLGMAKDAAYGYISSIQGMGVSTSKAAEVLTEMATAGGFAAKDILLVAKAAVDMEKYGGVAIKDTVAQFKKLKEDGSPALIDVAIQTGLVSAEIIKQAIEMEKSGNKTGAATLAMEAYGAAMQSASNTIKSELGILQRIGDTLTTTFANIWDSILGIGRSAPLLDQLMQEQAKLASLKDGGISLRTTQGLANEIQVQQAVVDGIKNEIKAQKDLADLKIKNTSDAKTLKANAGIEKDLDKQLLSFSRKQITQQEYINDKVSEYKEKVGEASVSQEVLNKLIKVSGEEWKRAQPKGKSDAQKAEEKAQKELNAAMETYNDILNKSVGFNSSFNNDLDKLQLAYSKTKMTTEEYTAAVQKLLAQQPFAIKQAKDEADAQKLINDSREKAIDILRRMNEASGVISTNRQETLGAIGLGSQAATELKTKQDSVKEYAKYQEELYKEFSKNKQLETKEYTDATAAIKAGLAERLLANQTYYDTLKQKQGDWTNGASTATANYLDSLGNVAGATEQTFTNAFKGMEDALVDFVKTGKLDFSSLANSIISDLIRITIQQSMMKPFAEAGGFSELIKMIPGFANGGSFTDGVQKFAKGGSFSNSVVDSPTLFKFAKGTGMMGEAGPEAIMPLRRDSSGSLGVVANGGGSSNVSVQVINNSSSQATTSETTDSRGNRKIEVVIGDMNASEISRSGSSSQKSIKSTFGLQPQLIRR